MNKSELKTFNATDTVHELFAATAAELFGKYYKYDFPKWCAENNLRCFYKPEILVYIIFPKEYKEL